MEGTKTVSCYFGRDQLDVDGLQFGHWAVLRDGAGVLRDLYEVGRVVGTGQVVLWRRRTAGSDRTAAKVLAGNRYPDREESCGRFRSSAQAQRGAD